MPANPNYQTSWADAQDWCIEFRRTWGKFVVWQLTPDPQVGAIHKWWVRLVIVKDMSKVWSMPDYAASEPFPNTNAGSLPGLIIYMINKAEQEFTRRSKVAEQRALF